MLGCSGVVCMTCRVPSFSTLTVFLKAPQAPPCFFLRPPHGPPMVTPGPPIPISLQGGRWGGRPAPPYNFLFRKPCPMPPHIWKPWWGITWGGLGGPRSPNMGGHGGPYNFIGIRFYLWYPVGTNLSGMFSEHSIFVLFRYLGFRIKCPSWNIPRML